VKVLSKHGAALQTECGSCGLTSAPMVSMYLASLREPVVEYARPVRREPEISYVRSRPKVDQRTAS
jgi:hypothetical protein